MKKHTWQAIDSSYVRCNDCGTLSLSSNLLVTECIPVPKQEPVDLLSRSKVANTGVKSPIAPINIKDAPLFPERVDFVEMANGQFVVTCKLCGGYGYRPRKNSINKKGYFLQSKCRKCLDRELLQKWHHGYEFAVLQREYRWDKVFNQWNDSQSIITFTVTADNRLLTGNCWTNRPILRVQTGNFYSAKIKATDQTIASIRATARNYFAAVKK